MGLRGMAQTHRCRGLAQRGVPSSRCVQFVHPPAVLELAYGEPTLQSPYRSVARRYCYSKYLIP